MMHKPKSMRPLWCALILIGFLSRLPPASGAEIRVDAGRLEERVNPELFGNSVMFDGNTMGYDWWVTDERGYDTAKAQWNYYLPYVSELNPTVLRYPSGLGANNFHWKAGIGPIITRDPDYTYGYPQVFGTDEFLRYCEELGAEAIMVVNVSTTGKRAGTIQDAADWVEYCNAPDDGSNPGGGIDWAAVRADNGHKEPYHVKYWELGNEEIYPGREDYGQRVRTYSKAMKAIDPTVKTGAICSGGHVDPIFQTEDWLDYQAFMLENAGDSFDFWSQHTHTPGSSGRFITGFTMVQDGAVVSVDFTLNKEGEYRIRFPVEGTCQLSCPELALTIDGERRGVWSAGPLIAFLESSWFSLAEGEHTLRLEARLPTNQTRIVVSQEIEFQREGDEEPLWIDLRNSRELYHAIFGGWAVVDWAFLRGEPHRGNKPVFYTETNTQYGVNKSLPYLSKACSLREMLSMGCLYNMMLRHGVQLATYWLLFQEQDGVGVLEGVAYDGERMERGRLDPHKRPVFHLLKAYQENALDWVVSTDVLDSESFLTGWQTGVVIGCAQKDFEMAYIQALATLSEESDRMSLFLMNLHPEKDIEVPIHLQGFPWKAEVKAVTITGSSPDANNEPENCPGGNCVTAGERVVRSAGNPMHYRLPKHSLTVLVFYREGSDQSAPRRPTGLEGSVKDGSAHLQWEANTETDVAGYFVFRSRCAEGPFRHRLNDALVTDTGYLDTATDQGVRYTYSIRAVDLSGNESDCSEKITLTPLPGDGNPDTGPPDRTPDSVPPSPPVLIEVRSSP
jgi:alpha-L-arabinofuranosidase